MGQGWVEEQVKGALLNAVCHGLAPGQPFGMCTRSRDVAGGLNRWDLCRWHAYGALPMRLRKAGWQVVF